MAGLSHADQSRLPVPRLDPGCAHRAGSSAVPRPGTAQYAIAWAGNSGMAELLLQVSHDRSGTLSGARSVHSADEVEEHSPLPEGRRADHAPGIGILRLTRKKEICEWQPRLQRQRIVRRKWTRPRVRIVPSAAKPLAS